MIPASRHLNTTEARACRRCFGHTRACHGIAHTTRASARAAAHMRSPGTAAESPSQGHAGFAVPEASDIFRLRRETLSILPQRASAVRYGFGTWSARVCYPSAKITHDS